MLQKRILKKPKQKPLKLARRKTQLLLQMALLNNTAPHLQRGADAEQQAYEFLIAQGLSPVCRNFRCKQGELDLVMLDQETLVIVEVRFRKSNRFGGAVESVTAAKRAKIIAATQYYLSEQAVDKTVRFDVVAISAGSGLNWIPNAFQT
jgi:putative endonuclease